MSAYTLKEIRDSYKQKKNWERQFPINSHIVRPFSFIVTYWVLKITTNPAKIASFGFLIGLLGFLFLSCSAIFSLWPGIILIILYSISDAVDGNVARATKSVTLFGKYLDGLLGDIIDGNYFFFLGLGLYFSEPSFDGLFISLLQKDYALALPLFLGAWIIICRLWALNFKSRYDTYRIRKEGMKPFNDAQMQEVIGKSTFSDRWYYLLFINIECLNNQLLLLVILTALNLTLWFLLLFALLYTIKVVFFFFYFFILTKSSLSDSLLFSPK